jgi:ABC-2 type transport system permease protein
VLFFAPVYVPIGLLAGWIHAIASVNPATAFLEGGRSLLAGDPEHVALAFSIALALVLAFAVWAVRGLRSAERAGA